MALKKATRNVINAITQFCEDNERTVNTTIDNYKKYLTEASLSMDREIVENFSFHDCVIIKSILDEKYITLILDNTSGFTGIDEATFENVTIIKQDAGLENSWWLYEEVYKVNDRYEFHVLLENQEMGLIDFVFSAERAFFRSQGPDVG
ncbi:hypothetical protein D3C78_1352590 [compost metagenome]